MLFVVAGPAGPAQAGTGGFLSCLLTALPLAAFLPSPLVLGLILLNWYIDLRLIELIDLSWPGRSKAAPTQEGEEHPSSLCQMRRSVSPP